MIGLPGDEVLIDDGKVYINGIKLEEPYVTSEYNGTYGPIKCLKTPTSCWGTTGLIPKIQGFGQTNLSRKKKFAEKCLSNTACSHRM